MLTLFSLDQRRRLLVEMEVFMETSELEQKTRLNDTLPTVESYWSCRMGTSAVGVCLAVNEYVIPAGCEVLI